MAGAPQARGAADQTGEGDGFRFVGMACVEDDPVPAPVPPSCLAGAALDSASIAIWSFLIMCSFASLHGASHRGTPTVAWTTRIISRAGQGEDRRLLAGDVDADAQDVNVVLEAVVLVNAGRLPFPIWNRSLSARF